ncbi:MAG: hypothetical protein ACFFD4_26345 [Candidatus Odinarchaeota archaeon]
MSFKIKESHLAILTLLEDKKERTITELFDMLKEAYNLTTSDSLKGSYSTVRLRLTRLLDNGYLEYNDTDKLYKITDKGLDEISESEKSELSPIERFRKVFESIKK